MEIAFAPSAWRRSLAQLLWASIAKQPFQFLQSLPLFPAFPQLPWTAENRFRPAVPLQTNLFELQIPVCLPFDPAKNYPVRFAHSFEQRSHRHLLPPDSFR